VSQQNKSTYTVPHHCNSSDPALGFRDASFVAGDAIQWLTASKTPALLCFAALLFF